MRWFNNIKSIEELKKQYKNLAIKHHPDRGGDLKNMQAINVEYDILFKKLKDIHQTSDGQTYEKETKETPEEFRNIINKIISIDDIMIEIIGSWVWVTGNTFPHKETLKNLKFRYSKSKKAWYFHDDGYTKIGKKTFTLDEIRSLYGSEVINSKPNLKLEIV